MLKSYETNFLTSGYLTTFKLLKMRKSRTMNKTTLCCVVWLSISMAIGASDPDPLQDFCVADKNQGIVKVNGFVCKDPKTVEASDFLFRGLATPMTTNNAFGLNVTAGNVFNFPGVNTLGISMNRGQFAPGGLNPPHIHPRGAEIIYLMEGTLLAGFVSTDNVLFSEKMEKGDVFVIPRGLVHFQYNVGASDAVTITASNSENPGVQILATTLFGSNPPLPEDVLTKAFNISSEQLKQLMPKQGSTPAPPPPPKV